MENKRLKDLKGYVENRLAIDNLSRNTRQREYAEGRSLFYRMARDLNVTWEDMGKFLGRHHATAIHGCNNVFPMAMKYNTDVADAYDYFITNYKQKFEVAPEEFTTDFLEVKKQRDQWKEKYDEAMSQLLEEKEWRHRFQKLTGDIPDDKREVVHARMNAIVKML